MAVSGVLPTLPEVNHSTTSTNNTTPPSQQPNTCPDSVSKHLSERDWRVRELVESEKDYVSDLGKCFTCVFSLHSQEIHLESKQATKLALICPPPLNPCTD